MKKEKIGLNTWRYEFRLDEREKFNEMWEKCSHKGGNVQELLVNNGLCFEHTVRYIKV